MNQPIPLSFKLISRSKEIFIRGLIWAFIGILYGLLFVFLSVLATAWEHQVHPYFFAGIFAGTIGALIYSSMRLAVLMAIIITPIATLIVLLADTPLDPFVLMLTIGILGGIIGALYGYFSKASRVHRADAKTLTGFCAGFLVSLGYLIVTGNQVDETSLALVIGIMCPLTGGLYVMFVPTFIRYFDKLLPSFWDGALVGIGVSLFLALSIFVMMNSINADSAGSYLAQVVRIQELLPQAILGGLVGGGLAGMISGIFFRNWQDL
jgi:hypothetical protein